jgi:hypothetical protein
MSRRSSREDLRPPGTRRHRRLRDPDQIGRHHRGKSQKGQLLPELELELLEEFELELLEEFELELLDEFELELLDEFELELLDEFELELPA